MICLNHGSGKIGLQEHAMTLSFSLSADAETKLRDWARASGVSPDDFARRIVEQAVTSTPNGKHSYGTLPDASKRVANLHEWTATVQPTGREVDDSRDSMYSGRGE